MHPRRKLFLDALQDPAEGVRDAASKALDRLDLLAGLPATLGRLAALDKVGWVSLLRSLGGIRDEVCLKLGLRGLGHPEEDVRLAALELVESFSDWRGTSHVIQKLSDSSPVVRARASEVLGKMGDRRAAEQLIPLLADPDPRVQAQAACAVGLLGCSEAEERLISLATHPDLDVRAAAIDALGRLALRPDP